MKTLILSLGGSLIAPDKPDYFFIREFKNFVLDRCDKYRFIIVCGGGKTASHYVNAALRVSKVDDKNLDWIGIMATRLNAELIRTVFGELADGKVIYNPTEKIKSDKKIIVAAGYEPGWSTDYDSVLLAEQFGANEIINMTNIDYVYDKDPGKHKDAKKLVDISWKDYRKISGSKWTPRLNLPFDPIASKQAQKSKLKVVILNGKNLSNIENYLLDKDFKGTVIHG
ncbi:MAG: UMP kinase [Nanoarchaeota archaeon]